MQSIGTIQTSMQHKATVQHIYVIVLSNPKENKQQSPTIGTTSLKTSNNQQFWFSLVNREPKLKNRLISGTEFFGSSSRFLRFGSRLNLPTPREQEERVILAPTL